MADGAGGSERILRICESSSVSAARGLQLSLLTIAITSAVYAKVVLGPLQEVMRTALTLSDHQIALLQGPALALSLVLISAPIGLLIDRYSRVRLLLVLLVLVVLGSLLTATATDFNMLFAARTLVGLGAFPIQMVVMSLVADLYAPHERGRAITPILVGQYAAVSAIFMLGGTLVTTLDTGADAWRWTIVWLIGPLFLVVLPAMFALREPPRTERTLQRRPSFRESWMEIWQYRAVLAMLLIGAIVKLIPLHAVLTWAAPTFARNFSLPPDQVGVIMALVLPVGGIAGSIAGGIVADMCQRGGGPLRTISAATWGVLVALPLSLFALMPDAISASIMLTLLVAIITTITQMMTAFALVVIPNEVRGLYFAISGGIVVIFVVGGAPVLVSTLSEVAGGPAELGKALTVVCVAGSLLCASTYAIGKRHLLRSGKLGHRPGVTS